MFFCVFDTEKRRVERVEIEFKVCFRNFLRYGLYGSCGLDKLSEAGEFYLHYPCDAGICFAASARLCLSIACCFKFCAAFGILCMCRSTFVLRALRVLLGALILHRLH